MASTINLHSTIKTINLKLSSRNSMPAQKLEQLELMANEILAEIIKEESSTKKPVNDKNCCKICKKFHGKIVRATRRGVSMRGYTKDGKRTETDYFDLACEECYQQAQTEEAIEDQVNERWYKEVASYNEIYCCGPYNPQQIAKGHKRFEDATEKTNGCERCGEKSMKECVDCHRGYCILHFESCITDDEDSEEEVEADDDNN